MHDANGTFPTRVQYDNLTTACYNQKWIDQLNLYLYFQKQYYCMITELRSEK